MKRKMLMFLCTVLTALCFALGFAACGGTTGGNEGGNQSNQDNQGNQGNQGNQNNQNECIAGKAFAYSKTEYVSGNKATFDAAKGEIENKFKGTYFLFNSDGTVYAIKDNIAYSSDYTADGSRITINDGHEETEGTFSGNEFTFAADMDIVVIKLTYTYDKDYKFTGTVEGNDDKPDDDTGIAGKAFIYDGIQFVSGDESAYKAAIAAFSASLGGTRYLFCSDNTVYGIKDNSAYPLPYATAGNVIRINTGETFAEMTYTGNEVVFEQDMKTFVVRVVYTLDKDYKFTGTVVDPDNPDPDPKPNPDPVVDITTENLAGKAFTFNCFNYVSGDVETYKTIVSQLESSLNGTHYLFNADGTVYGIDKDGTGNILKYYIEKGKIIMSYENESTEASLNGNDLVIEVNVGGLVMNMIYTYENDFKFGGFANGD